MMRVRKMLQTLFVLSVIFVFVENFATYLSLTMRKDIFEVGYSTFLIDIFGLETGILISFFIVVVFVLLCYYKALHSLPKRREDLSSRSIFRLSFMGLTGICFGLFPSALNDTSGLLFGFTPLGWLDQFSRYLFFLITCGIGIVLAFSIERKL